MSTLSSIEQQLEGFRKDFETLKREIGKAIVGQDAVIDGVLTAIIAGGHVLVEGPPGYGKTALCRALGDTVQLGFQRIQFTPDLMPADLIGTYVVMENQQGRRTFEFQQGPIFNNIIMADQINRGMPKTQSALLEAMEGDQITVSRESFELPKPFVVIATQNPLEMEGTFPLPEPQIDRFLYKVVAVTPTPEEMLEILERTTEFELPPVASVLNDRRLIEMRDIARRVPVDGSARMAAVTMVAATSPGYDKAPAEIKRYVQYGSSPRGAQALILGAKVLAASQARNLVTLDDIKTAARPALRHRLILNFEGQAEAVSPDTLVDAVVQSVSSTKSKAPAPPTEA